MNVVFERSSRGGFQTSMKSIETELHGYILKSLLVLGIVVLIVITITCT